MHLDFKNKMIKFYEESKNKLNSMKFKKWINENLDIKTYLETELQRHKNLTKISNIFICIVRGIPLDSFNCKTCGKELKIRSITQPVQFCSSKCAINNEELQIKRSETIHSDLDFYSNRQEKIKKTCLERYGTKTPAESEQIKIKIKEKFSCDKDIWKKRNEKSKLTCLERYGVEHASSTDEVKKKVITTNLKKFGIENPNKLDEFKEKIKATNILKYGVDCQFKRKEIIELNLLKSWKTIKTWTEYIEPLFTFEDYSGYSKNQIYKWKCKKCGNEFEQHLYHTKIFNISTRVPRCLNCYPITVNSVQELELKNFCEQYFNIEKNNRQLIKPLELDVVIPEKKIAFEFNGIYWHSDQRKSDPMYHLNKTLECEKNGYKLIHIWEYDWINPIKQNILKEKIKALLGVDQTKIYARKCEIKEIDSKTKNEFLNKYHIQGEDKSKIKLGLFYENELIAVMTFGKPRFNNNYEWELIRYATKSGCQVLGGAGKLLKYFERNYSPKNLITYADRSYSQGNMYRQIGFNLVKISEPSYNWTNGLHVYSRFQCLKSRLEDILGDKFESNLSENENMSLNGFYKLYDCGNFVFEKNY